MNQLTAEDREVLQARAYSDPEFFCRTFLGDWFPSDMPWVHAGILAILTRQTDWLAQREDIGLILKHFVYEDGGVRHPIFEVDGDAVHMKVGRFTQIMMPRGFSKTTIVNACVLWNIYFRERRVIVYLSETATHSEMQLTNIKRQIERNTMLTAVFGTITPPDRESGRWRQDHIETQTGITVQCRGRGGQVRGINVDAARPDFIVVDDVENKESVATEEQRKKTRSWMYGDVMPALPALDRDATIVAVGTMLHGEALLCTLQRDSRWTTIKFGAKLADGEMLWPAMMNEVQWQQQRQAYQAVGELSGFHLEFQNELRIDEGAKFKETYFQFGRPEGEFHYAIAIDPAISNKPSACQAAIAVVGMSTKGKIVVEEIWAKTGATVREMIDVYFALHKKYSCTQAGVESIAFQAALVHIMREEMFRKHQYFEITPITHSMNKIVRIESVLQPRYAGLYIWHSTHFPEYETALLDWPAGKIDIPDAVSMALTLLDPYAAQAAGEKDMAEDEYPPLGKMIGGEWRVIA